MIKYIFIALFGLGTIAAAHAQTDNSIKGKEAEELFQDIFPLGIGLGVEYAPWKESGQRGEFNFGQSDLWIPELEFSYNVFQKNRFNFRAGLKARVFQYRNFMPLNAGNYGTREPTELIHNRIGEYSLNLPLTVEHISTLSEDSWLAFHAGYELQYYNGNMHREKSERSIEPNGVIHLKEIGFKDNITHGLNLGTGIYKKLGTKLMKFELNYHLHFSELITQELQADNLPNHPDISAKNKWSGNHLDAKVTFYLFNKKRK